MSKYKILEDVAYIKVNEFNIKQNGIQVVEDENQIEIYNDPFRSVPLFVTKNGRGELIIFSNFKEFYNMENIDKTVDEAGFWEIVFFGSGLWSRTLYKSVKQMPGASKITIDKNRNNYTIERYWDFDILEDKSIDSVEKAAKGLYERLDKIFSKLDRGQKYVMGMSGGMDSRISLAFLSKYIPKENLELFTFGFDERVLEYRYACEVAAALGYNKPKFHKLTKDSYKKAMEYLPQMSGGQIGINHCHILDYLRCNNLKNYKHISNYLSDALFGYDCTSPKKSEKIDENYYLKYLQTIDYLPAVVKEIITLDVKNIFKGFSHKSNFSSLSEYKYLTERNQKFHSYLAYIQNGDLVLADYDLLNYMLSVPIKFREQKKLIDYILEHNFKNISSTNLKNISSRDFNGVSFGFTIENRFVGLIEWYEFKVLNRLNALLRVLTKGRIQLFNKYQTEEQERLLYRDFQDTLKAATLKFKEAGLMTDEQKKRFDKVPLRSSGISERFNLISLGELL